MKTSSEFLTHIFNLLNKEANYAVLRNFDGLPKVPGRDIDMIINRKDFLDVRGQILDVIKEFDYKIIQYYRGAEMYSLVIGKVGEGSNFELLSFDFLFSIYVKNAILISSEEVLKTRQFNGDIYHVRKDMEYLSKWLYNKILGEPYPAKYKEVEAVALLEYADSIKMVQKRIFGDENNNSFRSVLIKGFKRDFCQATVATIRYYWNSIRNLLSPQGFSIGFTGPDGVGKTTVITQIQEQLEKVYSKIALYHFRPLLFGNLSDVAHSAGLKKEVDRDYSNPHRGGKTSKISSLLRLIYYSFDYILGYIPVYKLLFKRRLVIFDRYYTDIVCDSRRSRIYLNPKFLYGFGKLFIPSLDYNILLTADTDVILARKQELDREGIEAINGKIDYLADKKGYYKVLNNSTPQEAVGRILGIVFEEQHRRNLRRLR